MTIYIILGILVCILGYSTFNLMKKNEKLEEMVLKQNTFIAQTSEALIQTSLRLEEIDNKGIFKSDDEIGWFFDEVLKLDNMLNAYILENNNNNGEKNEKKTST